MKFLIAFLICFSACSQQHCGYDFTSYVVLHVHEDGKKENISGLHITLADSTGNTLINKDNKFSWKNKDEVLVFSENYKIDKTGNKLEPKTSENFKWFFPFSKDTYFLSVTNEFPADLIQVRIEDPLGRYETAVVQLYAFNLYVLCPTQAEQQAQQFGRRVNKPVDIILSKKK